MKILVTGANGYLGQGIVKTLLDRNVEVIATDISLDNVDERAIKVACDLFSIEEPYAVFHKPDVVLHLAWRDGFVHYADSHIENLPLHYKFITRLAEAGIKKIAVMGSMHEIGHYEGCVDENTPCNPMTPYGISKNALRELTEMICNSREIDYQWLRGFYIVGNSANGCSVFSKVLACCAKGDGSFPFTSGLNKFDFIDYEDFCELVAITIMQNEVKGVINICTGYATRLIDRMNRFIVENELDIILDVGAFPDRPYDSRAIWGDSEKIDRIKLLHNE